MEGEKSKGRKREIEMNEKAKVERGRVIHEKAIKTDKERTKRKEEICMCV